MNFKLIKKLNQIILSYCLIVSVSALAKNSSQIIPFEENEQISVVLSNRDINRIMIEGDKIQNINAPLGMYVAKNDNKGSLYVTLNGSLPFTMYLNTTNGHNLALFINPRAIIGKSIILHPTMLSMNSAHAEDKPNYQKSLIKLIKSMIKQVVPEDYLYRTIPKQKNLDFYGIANLKPIGIYIGAHFIGMVFEIVNKSKTTIDLKPDYFYKPSIRAVALSLQTLRKGQFGLVYEVIAKEDKSDSAKT